MVKIYESILDDWTPDGQQTSGQQLAKRTNSNVYDCKLRIGVAVADKMQDSHYIDWMTILTYKGLWQKFLNELFDVLDRRPEIRDFRCDKYLFVDINADLDKDEDNEVWCDLSDVQQVFDRNRLYYESDRKGSVFALDVYMDAGFYRTRQCVTLVRLLFGLFSESRAVETGDVFWIDALCAGECNAIGCYAFNMEERYWGGKLAQFCRGLIGMCETGQAGHTNVHCYRDIEKYCKFNFRDDILKRYSRDGFRKGNLVEIRKNVPLDKVKFSIVTLFRPTINTSEFFPLNWLEYNSATNEIDHADLLCKLNVLEAEEKCMYAADLLKQSGSTCDAYVYSFRGRPFGLLYINYDLTVIIDDEEYIVMLTSKYYIGRDYDEDDLRASLCEMTEDLEAIGISPEEAHKYFDMAKIGSLQEEDEED